MTPEENNRGIPRQIPYAGLSDLEGYIIGAVRGYYYGTRGMERVVAFTTLDQLMLVGRG